MKKILAPRTSSLLLTLLLVCSGSLSSQTQLGELQGHVIDSEGSPLPGVAVTLSGLPEPRVRVTDSAGHFRFADLPVGTYRLRAEFKGCPPVENLPVSIGLGPSQDLEITLGPADRWKTDSRKLDQFDRQRVPEDWSETQKSQPAAPSAPSRAPTAPLPTLPPPADPVESSVQVVGAVGEPDVRNYVQVEVFYGTDRFTTGSKIPAQHFSAERSRSRDLHLGVCRVSVPRNHQPGVIEEPSIWKWEFRPDPGKHMVLLGLSSLPRSAFFQRMASALDKSKKKEVLVFIHGFNVAFADAALRTAQMAYDLHIDGVPILYSWPSQASLAHYTVDATNAEWTVPHLEVFLQDIAAQSKAHSIYLIAHSMGNRSLTWALERLAAKLGHGSKPPFTEILLTAPDIDAGVFSNIAQEFSKAAERVTLYASSNDHALVVSKSLNGYPRAGDSGPDLVVLPGVDTIDVSALDTGLLGHSYYGDNCSVLSDISKLLKDHQPPLGRGLDRKEKNGLAYWLIHRADSCHR